MADTPDEAPLPISVVVTLRSPITTHDGSTTALTVNAPKARDLIALRTNPHTIYSDGRFETRHDIMVKLVAALTGVDELILGDLTTPDWNAVTAVVRAYLGEAGNVPALFR